MKSLRLTAAALLTILALGSFTAAAESGQETTLMLYYPYMDDSVAGMSIDATSERVLDLMEKILGRLKIRGEAVTEAMSVAEVKQAFEQGRLDLTFALTMEMINYRDAGVPVRPLVTYTINGEKTNRDCIYVMEDSGFETVADLRGRSMTGPETAVHWAIMRELLEQEGIDESPVRFFGDLQFYRDEFIKAQALAAGEIDSMSAGTDTMSFVRLDSTTGKLKTLACSEEYSNLPIAVREDLDPELVEGLKLLALNAHRDPALSDVRFIFLAMKGSLVESSWEDFESLFRLWDKARERGWVAEFCAYGAEHESAMQPVGLDAICD